MRETVNLEEFESGFKAFAWVNYCLKIDSLREELIPDYDVNNIPKELADWDRQNFEKYYSRKYGNARQI